MKIGILGNMNNNSNNLVQYLRAAGADAHLLFFENEAGHFMPDADEVAPIDYPTQHLSWGSYKSFLNPLIGRKVRRDIAPFDVLIGSRLTPAYLARFTNRALDGFMPTGGDIWTVPHFTDYTPRNLLKWAFISRAQRKGIQVSRRIFMDRTNADVEALIEPLFDRKRRIETGVPAIYAPAYTGAAWDARLSHSKMRTQFEKIRQDADLFFVHHVKHLWQPASVQRFDQYQAKGNDQIFHALSVMRRERPGLKIKVLMCEFGSDLQASKALSHQLGVSDMIEWIPLSPRREIMVAISMADAVIGEIAQSWLTYGTIIEAMVMNTPVIHNRNDDFFGDRQLYPMYHAKCSSDIVQAMLRIADTPDEAREIGRKAHDWYATETIDKQVCEILSLGQG